MTPTKEQRAMMAADLWSRAARRVLEGEPESAMRIADRATMLLSETERALVHYRNGLHIAGSTNDDAQASCDAIARGEHPATSLPGMVIEMRNEVAFRGKLRHAGKSAACQRVLMWLGCKVTPGQNRE